MPKRKPQPGLRQFLVLAMAAPFLVGVVYQNRAFFFGTRAPVTTASAPAASLALGEGVADASPDVVFSLVPQVRVTAPCAFDLDADRAPTDDELLSGIFPERRGGAVPTHHPLKTLDDPFPATTFLVSLCTGAPVRSLTSPAIALAGRVPFTAGREVLQAAVGTGAGLVDTTVGVLALIQRDGSHVRVLWVDDVAGRKDEAHAAALDAIRAGSFGDHEVLLTESPDAPWGEDREHGASASVRVVREKELSWAGLIPTTRASNGVFWRGVFRWKMTSGGLEAEPGGYLVRERWTFLHKSTKKKSAREVVRHYRLAKDQVEASPKGDLDAWPETSTQRWPDPPLPDDDDDF